MSRLASLALVLALFALSACSDSEDPNAPGYASQECAFNAAEIQIYDGLIQRLCGCSEGASSAIEGSIDCTVSRNTVVFFHFLGNKLTHQLVPSNASSDFRPLAVVRSEDSTRTYTATFSEIGTFSFRDAYSPVIAGRIIVR